MLLPRPNIGINVDRSHPLSSGLKMLYLFNEKSGGGIMDITNNNPRNGVLNNFSNSSSSGWVGSPYGGGLLFDGVDDYVSINRMVFQRYVDYNKPYTIAISFTFKSIVTTQAIIGCANATTTSTTTYDDIMLYVDSGKLCYEFAVNRGSNLYNGRNWVAAASNGFVTGTRYHVVISYDGTNTFAATSINAYLNNSLVSMTSGNAYGAASRSIWTTYTDPNVLRIGSREYPGSPIPSNIVVHSIRLYDRRLNSFEVDSLYKNDYIGLRVNKQFLLNPTLYGLGAWNGKLVAAGNAGTLTAAIANNAIESGMFISFLNNVETIPGLVVDADGFYVIDSDNGRLKYE